MTALALGLHTKLTREGISPQSDGILREALILGCESYSLVSLTEE